MKKKKTTEELIESLAITTAKNFELVRGEMREGFKRMDERFDRLEFTANGHDRRLDILEDKVRRISVKIGLK